MTCTINFSGLHVVVDYHAAERYIERVKPTFTIGQAFAELARLLPLHGHLGEIPDWKASRPPEGDAGLNGYQQWLLLGDDVAFPALWRGDKLVLTTCVARGGISEATRAKRADYRRRRARVRKETRTERGGWRRGRQREDAA
jgi:hypothetical protein